MKKTLCRILSLALCAVLVCALPAFAAEAESSASAAPAYMAPVRVWGQATALEGGGLLVQNSDQDDPYREIILYKENALILDAVSGLPLDRELRDGETVYAWVGPAMTLSLPPQASAEIIVANIPADAGVPQYYQIAAVKPRAVIAIYPTPPLTQVDLVTTGGQELTVTDKAVLTPYLTRQMVYLSSLVPGSRMLVWSDSSGSVTKVMLFAYDYQGYIAWEPTGGISVNDQRLSASGKTQDGEILLPIRAVAEAAGYQVTWIPGQGAVVTKPGAEIPVFSVLPGQNTAQTAGGETTLSGTCRYENGVTYLPAGDLVSLLNLFPTYYA